MKTKQEGPFWLLQFEEARKGGALYGVVAVQPDTEDGQSANGSLWQPGHISSRRAIPYRTVGGLIFFSFNIRSDEGIHSGLLGRSISGVQISKEL